MAWPGNVESAETPRRLPVVLAQTEVRDMFARVEGTSGRIQHLICGTGVRILECLRLRVKDIEFTRHEMLNREGKAAKDRITMLPAALKRPLAGHLSRVKLLHLKALEDGHDVVYPPFALERKYPRCRARGESPSLFQGCVPLIVKNQNKVL